MKCWILPLLLALTGCSSLVQLTTEKQVSIDYVGHLSLSKPTPVRNGIKLHLTFHGGEWTNNSAVYFAKATGRVEGRDIFIRVFTAVMSGGTRAEPSVVLKGHFSGDYRAYYENPDGTIVSIGHVRIPSSKAQLATVNGSGG